MTMKQGKMLIIDDEEDILKSLQRQFRRKYSVYTVESAEEGYEFLQENPIEVIVCDQRMPGEQGSEFFKRVRKEFPDTIRLMITGYTDIEAVIQAINDGNVYRYITKPWDPLELDTIIDDAFSHYKINVERKWLLVELESLNQQLEQKVAERTAQLLEANRRLADLNQQKNEFLGMAAHDLRNSLQVILGYGQLLLGFDVPLAKRQQRLTMIYQCAEAMGNVLDNLLDVSKIESGTITLSLESVDINSYVEQIIAANKPIAEAKNISLRIDLAEDLPALAFDPKRIEQVFYNLISNACKFSPEGTTVTIRIRGIEEGMEFAILDEGPGISSQEIEKLFVAFHRAKDETTRRTKGFGLGLAVCKKMVEIHGGKIDVQNRPQGGSEFSFVLPFSLGKGYEP